MRARGHAREITREAHTLRRDDFVVHQVEADRLRSIGIIEVTADRVTGRLTELIEIVRFGENRGPNGARDVPAFGRFLDDKQDFGHGCSGVMVQ
jgi:hypothetical protein